MKKILILLIISLFTMSLLAVAQEKDEMKKTEPKECTCKDVCLPCGEKIKDTDKAMEYQYNDETYYFCNEKCLEMFKKDPEKYIEKCNCEHEIKCPVSGEVIKDKEKAPKMEYKGKTYYFCCENCKETFEKDPSKYVKECCSEEKETEKESCKDCSKEKEKATSKEEK